MLRQWIPLWPTSFFEQINSLKRGTRLNYLHRVFLCTEMLLVFKSSGTDLIRLSGFVRTKPWHQDLTGTKHVPEHIWACRIIICSEIVSVVLPSLVQFVCIAQQDYCCILNQVEKNMQKVEEEGEIVMVKEHRELDRTGTRKGHIVIKVIINIWSNISSPSTSQSNDYLSICQKIFSSKCTWQTQ